MLRRSLSSFALFASLATSPAAIGWTQPAERTGTPAPVEVVTLEMFEAELTPHGDWIALPSIGRAWRPAVRSVGRAFVPYTTHGHWTFTEDGWVFDSDLSWGWATFHYGRWVHDHGNGWVWIPGVSWAPAWVTWRSGGGYVGWVAAPPTTFPIVTRSWTFVEERNFLQRPLQPHVVAPPFIPAVYRRTQPSTAYVMRAGVRWNTGPSANVISRATRTEIRPQPRRSPVPSRVRNRSRGAGE